MPGTGSASRCWVSLIILWGSPAILLYPEFGLWSCLPAHHLVDSLLNYILFFLQFFFLIFSLLNYFYTFHVINVVLQQCMNSQYSCWENPIDRNLAGNSPWGHKESDTTEHLSIEHRQQCIMIICMFTYVSVFFILGEQLKKIPGFCSCELPEARSHVCFVPYFISCPCLVA